MMLPKSIQNRYTDSRWLVHSQHAAERYIIDFLF